MDEKPKKKTYSASQKKAIYNYREKNKEKYNTYQRDYHKLPEVWLNLASKLAVLRREFRWLYQTRLLRTIAHRELSWLSIRMP